MRTGTERNFTGKNNLEICGASGDSWVTWSWEWWYIQRRAAEVMLGALVPYAACSAFSTRAMALKWCSFQKLCRWEGWQMGQYHGVSTTGAADNKLTRATAPASTPQCTGASILSASGSPALLGSRTTQDAGFFIRDRNIFIPKNSKPALPLPVEQR